MAPDAFGLIWKNEEMRAFILEENGSEDLAKPRISNRKLSVDSRTLSRHADTNRVLWTVSGRVSGTVFIGARVRGRPQLGSAS